MSAWGRRVPIRPLQNQDIAGRQASTGPFVAATAWHAACLHQTARRHQSLRGRRSACPCSSLRADYDPTLKLGIIDVPVIGADQFSLTRDSFTMGTIGLAQKITRSERRQARTTRFEREAEAAEAGRTLMLANLRRDTAIAWLDTYFQERARDVLLTQRDETRLQVEAADAATGTASLSHVPVKSLAWPAITMGVKVADKSMLNELSEGKKVTVEVSKVNSDYELNAVK